jgi:glycosyltransferase involved in cell wall biosynthesis
MQLVNLLAAERNGRYEHEVLLVRDGPLARRFRNLAPTTVLGKRGKVDPRFYLRLVAALRRSRPQILHTWTETPNFWGPSAAHLAGVPHVVMAETAVSEPKAAPLRLIEWANYRLADKVVGCCRAVASSAVSRGAPSRRTGVVYLGVDAPEPDDGSERVPYLVLMLGRFDPRKGHEVLLDAIPQVLAQVPAAHFVLAGPAGSPQTRQIKAIVQQRIRDLGLQERVDVLDAVDAAANLRRATLLVLPSLSEGLPNVVLEAFAHSVPVVATAVGGVPELVTDGDSGWIVPPGRPSALAAALIAALGNPGEAQRRGERGRCRVEALTLGASVAAWTEVYDQVRGVSAATAPESGRAMPWR